MSNEQNGTVSSPYATGGGGTRLEHEYAATALACLLTGQPFAGLGDEFTPATVALQQEAITTVDDLVVTGISSTGQERQFHVACRRRPTLGRSSPETVKLFADYLGVLLRHPQELDSGAMRLGLMVSGPFGPADQLDQLTQIARCHPTSAAFETAVQTPGAHAANVRDRLQNVYDLVEDAAALLPAALTQGFEKKRSGWDLLRGLYVIQAQLEGGVAPGTTAVVGQLAFMTENDLVRAESLRLRLVEIAASGAIQSASFNRAMLRRELHAFGRIGASPSFDLSRAKLDELERSLRQRTRRVLPVGDGTEFRLPRTSAEQGIESLASAAKDGEIVLLEGEPDVGKSSLALDLVDSVRSRGGTALVMSLRDLGASPSGLQSILGQYPQAALSSAPSGGESILVLDGAEVVQEGDSGVLVALMWAATQVGFKTMLVARSDARSALEESLRDAGLENSQSLAVKPLDEGEVDELILAIPALRPIRDHPRSAWLLGRLGLIELLLRAIRPEGTLPSALVTEADVFAVVWTKLVRRNEISEGGVTPDEREQALVDVARRLLTAGNSVSSATRALPSLRSDGLLLPHDATAVFRSGDVFASDVIRDFAVARLLLREDLGLVGTSSAPRWAVRAVRLYAQSRLADALREDHELFAKRFAQLRAGFVELARAHGSRWAELPWEALLSADWSDRALAELALSDDADMWEEILRTVKLRFQEAGACEPDVGAPVVQWLIDAPGVIAWNRHSRDDVGAETVLSWLRGVGRREAAGLDIDSFRELRTRVRESLLSTDVGSDSWLEGLGLLGSDGDARAESALRSIALDHPHRLAAVVESIDVELLLSAQNTTLLEELAEAYYIEQPKKSIWGSSSLDEGIRRHRSGGGFGGPFSAWYMGPFLMILRRDFRLGLKLINAMLDRAACVRRETLSRLGADDDAEPGLRLQLLDTGDRLFVGDTHVWSWYRGSSVGPYPCTSALLALEMVADEFVLAGATPRRVVELLLQDATTLATPGLVYGFLIRHVEAVTDELDGFLASPDVWRLEFGRTVSERGFGIRGTEGPDIAKSERKSWTPREAAASLILAAVSRNDNAALERLRLVGVRLVDAAGSETAPPEVRQWASCLDWECYSTTEVEGGLALEVTPPADVVEALASGADHARLVTDMYRLLSRYRTTMVKPYDASLAAPPGEDELAGDFECGMQLEKELEQQPLGMLRSALSGLACAVLNQAAEGAPVPSGSVVWAESLLVDAAIHPDLGEFPTSGSMFSDGADRTAALCLPLALDSGVRAAAASQVGPDGVDRIQLETALVAGMTSFHDEVRLYAAQGIGSALEMECGSLSDGGCIHEPVWVAIEAGARAVLIGAHDGSGQGARQTIQGDLATVLDECAPEALVLSGLVPALISTLDATHNSQCLAERARALLPSLLCAYARAECHYSLHNFDRRDGGAAVAAAVLRASGSEGATTIEEFGAHLRPSAGALSAFLNGLAVVATYEQSAVGALASCWPNLMNLGFAVLAEVDSAEDRYGREDLIRHLIPSPSPSTYVGDIDELLAIARSNWLPVTAIAGRIDEWLELARGDMSCVDALVGFLEAQSAGVQAKPGLEWVRRIVVSDDGSALTSGITLPGWLGRLRESDGVPPSAVPNYRAIVDALVLSNYTGGRDLQAAEE